MGQPARESVSRYLSLDSHPSLDVGLSRGGALKAAIAALVLLSAIGCAEEDGANGGGGAADQPEDTGSADGADGGGGEGVGGSDAAIGIDGGSADVETCDLEVPTLVGEPPATEVLPHPDNDPACPDDPTGGCAVPGCRYELECHSGHRVLDCQSFDRTPTGDCEPLFDYCPGPKLLCASGGWRLVGGTDEPPACPWAPRWGDACGAGYYGGPDCGYYCHAGDRTGWTVGTCVTNRGRSQAGIWVFDGTCEGDCSQLDAELVGFWQQSARCQTADDCTTITSRCSRGVQHCSGTLYVAKDYDRQQWKRLETRLSECVEATGAQCCRCDEPAPPPSCQGGFCLP